MFLITTTLDGGVLNKYNNNYFSRGVTVTHDGAHIVRLYYFPVL